MSDLQAKLKTLQGLLPSQRQWMERLTFQLEFNPYQLVHIVGGAGSGKSTLCLSIAELLSDDFNLALLKVEPGLPAFLIRQHLLESWFGFCPDGNKPLMQLIGERQSNLPLALVLDQADNVPAELWAELSQVPCLVVAASLQPDPHAELNLPLAPITLEDAEQLLHDNAFSTLTIADRLDQAEGNLHVLLDPSTKPKTRQPHAVASTKPASIWPPLVTFALGMLVIGVVVVFWFWTERDLRQQPGVGQLTYLPQEEEVVAPAVVAKVPDNSESKKVVKELVDQLDVVKGSASSEASGMAQPERFDDSPDAVMPERSNATAGEEITKPEKPLVSEPVVSKQIVEQATAEPAKITTQKNSDDVVGSDQQSATVDADELPSTPAPSTQLEPETTVEDEIASELQSIQQDSRQSTTTVDVADNSVEQSATDMSRESTLTNADELVAPAQSQVSEIAPNTIYQFNETALLALSGEDKALQLVVFSNENALNSFKQSYPQLKTYTYARTKNGQKQLVVVMAPYNDASMAKAQISKLPAAFQNAFVKAIAEIHSEISTN